MERPFYWAAAAILFRSMNASFLPSFLSNIMTDRMRPFFFFVLKTCDVSGTEAWIGWKSGYKILTPQEEKETFHSMMAAPQHELRKGVFTITNHFVHRFNLKYI